MKLRGCALVAGALIILMGTPAEAQSNLRGTAALNGDIQNLWSKLAPGLRARALAEAQANLNGMQQRFGIIEIKVRRVTNVDLVAPVAPGFTDLRNDGFTLAVPLRGSWTIRITVDVVFKLRLGFLRPSVRLPVTLAIEDLSMVVGAGLDLSDPGRPALQRVGQPRVGFRLVISSTNGIAQTLFRFVNPVANLVARVALIYALHSIVLPNLQGYPGPVWADGAAPLRDSGRAVPFEEIAANVDRKIRRDHLPHGTLFRANMDTPAIETWENAYQNGGPGNVGNVVSRSGGGDSAMWSGHFLASQAFRYHATRSSEALDNIGWMLRGIGALLDVNASRGSGLLARVAAPESSPEGQQIVRRGVFGRAQLFGQTWVGRQGDNGISRDQYTGVFFALTITHDLVNDPGVQAICRQRIGQMLDYLIAEDWLIANDRPNYRQAGGGFPTFWTGTMYQQLNLLIMGDHALPGRYAAEIARRDPLASVAWLGTWFSANTLDGYYKFNLQMINFYNYFRLETNAQRFQEMQRAYRITQRWVGHHHNPHFDLIQTSIDPSLRPQLFPVIREAMRQFVRRHHREIAPAVVDLTGVQWTTHDFYGPTGRSTERVPTAPLPIVSRKYTGFFQWQKQPVRPAIPNSGIATGEKPGIDLVLPVWHGKYQGAF